MTNDAMSKAGCSPSVRWSSVIGHWSFIWLLVIGHFLTGCSPSSNSPDLHSRVFSHVEVIGTRGTGLGQFTKPRSLALDRDDNLFVVDLTGRVQKFSPGGEVLSSWRMPETDLGKPKGMCRDTNGNIVIVEPHYQRVNHFAPDGTLVEQWGSHGTNGGQLVLPRSVAVNRHGDIFVSEYTTVDRVQGFSANGRKPILMFGRPGTGDGEFNRAEGLDVDAQDRIYVADSCNHRIQIFSRDGRWLKTYGKAGRGLGELSYPFDVRVDRAGRQYVCEFGNSRIQVFGTNNEPLEIIGGPGSKPGQFNNPWAIALDSHGNLFVADAGNHRVQKLAVTQGHSSEILDAPRTASPLTPTLSPLRGEGVALDAHRDLADMLSRLFPSCQSWPDYRNAASAARRFAEFHTDHCAPSPLNGERVGVRGENAQGLRVSEALQSDLALAFRSRATDAQITSGRSRTVLDGQPPSLTHHASRITSR